MRKTALAVCVAAVLLLSGVTAVQAALIEFVSLSDVPPDTAGSQTFDVRVSDLGGLSNIAAFNLWIIVSGADGVTMPRESVAGPALTDYIFHNNSFAFTSSNPGGDLRQITMMDTTADGTGSTLADGNLLARITVNYPRLTAGTILTLSLDPEESFALSDFASGNVLENLQLTGKNTINVIPIPGTIFLLVPALAGLVGIRRRFGKA